MKRYGKLLVCALALALALGTAGVKDAFCEELKIGYINFEKIFESFNKTKDKNEDLQKRKYEKEVEGQKLVDDINKIKNEMQLLSDEMKEKKQKELTDKMRDLRDFTNDSKEELLKERDEIFRNLTLEIKDLVEDKGKKENYTLIFDDQVLFFKSKAIDLTDEIIKELNEKYKKDKPAGSAPASDKPAAR